MISITVTNYIGEGPKLWSVTHKISGKQELILAETSKAAEEIFIEHYMGRNEDLFSEFIGLNNSWE